MSDDEKPQRVMTLDQMPKRPFDDFPYIPMDYWDALTPVYLDPSFFNTPDWRARVMVNLDKVDDSE